MNETVQELLRRVQSTSDFGYVTFDSVNDTNALGDNALHCVCVWGDIDAAKLLVENGIHINQRGEYGFTPLRVAVDFGFREIADYLIANGADPRALESEEVFDHERHAVHMKRLGEHI
jgi:ankyrin repeat protein